MATINGTSGNDTLNGSAGADTIQGLAGDDVINGNGGADTIDGGDGSDRITTGSGNDNITTGTGLDNVAAGAGNDWIYSRSSGGTFDGGDGYDSYQGNFAAAATSLSVVIDDGAHISNGVEVINVETISIVGGTGDDLFMVNRFRDSGTLYGGDGHDTLVFSAPASADMHFSVVASGSQLDGIIGTVSSGQTFYQFESVSFTGGQYNDQLDVRADYSANSAEISFDGAGGTDTLLGDFSLFTGATSLVVASDGTITSNRGQYSHIEIFALAGGAGADSFTTGSGADTLSGGTGADHLDGGAGNDFIYSVNYVSDDDGSADVLSGGAGDDRMAAGYGDSVDGGTGVDLLYYDAHSGSAGITANFSTLTGGGTISVGGATLSGIEKIGQITGTNFDDTIIAGAPAANAEIVSGLAGNDHLTGSGGGDTLSGGDGNDTLSGGAGQDTLNGLDGSDTFRDTAAGLNSDIIDLTLEDSIIITDANINNFTFNLSGQSLTYTGGSLIISAEVVGHMVAAAAAGGGVELKLALAPVGTNDQLANQLINGFWNWNDEGAHHFNVGQGGTLKIDIHTLNSTEQTMARAAFAQWHDIIGINFQEVTSGAQIIITNEEDAAAGAYTDDISSGGVTASAHIHIPSSWVTEFGSEIGTYGFQTYLHEIGHALGLGHPGNYNQTAVYGTDAIFANDSYATTVMSYFDQSESYYFAERHFSTLSVGTPMQADILAAQLLYGTPTTTRAGDTVYGEHTNAGEAFDAVLSDNVAYTIFDSGGNDTIDYSDFASNQLIDLNPETFSNVGNYTGNMSIARGVVIENALGGLGNDTLIGNGVANFLQGNAGNDSLEGNEGNDTLDGGPGDDTIAGGEGDDIIHGGGGNDILTDGAGNDQVYGDDGYDIFVAGAGDDTYVGGTDNYLDVISYQGALAGVFVDFSLNSDQAHSLAPSDAAGIGTDQLIGISDVRGSNFADTLSGDASVNELYGGGGNDNINGGDGSDLLEGGTGDDLLNGGAGEDAASYLEALAGVTVSLAIEGVQNTGAGLDTLIGIEKLYGSQFDDTLTGDEGGNFINGNDGDDTLYGLEGSDWLDGNSGSDVLYGGVGDDNYVVTDSRATIVEVAGEGHDTVWTSVDVVLEDNVEDAAITTDAGVHATGNSLSNYIGGREGDDVLLGEAGNDTLYGQGGNDDLDGGLGADSMSGGSGNDTYHIDDVGDVALENTGEGNDTIVTSSSYSLGESNIENLTLTGTADVNGFGNALDNVITGNNGSGELDGGAGNDIAYGNGGSDALQGWAGNDSLYGGSGNDELLGGEGNDVLDGGFGIDEVTYVAASAGVTVSLAITGGQDTLGDGFDRLIGIENIEGSSFADILTGDAGANSIHARSGNDHLDGGAGADKLYGGLGDDTFIVDNVGDIISEYTGEGTDVVQTSVTYTLRSGLENLTLTGSAAIDGTGNAVANTIRGNNAANALDGGVGNDTLFGNGGDDTLVGGSGNDTLQGSIGNDSMTGGLGNDIYYVDSLGDVVTENVGEGTDLVRSSIDYTLGANLEDLTLLGVAASARGNALNNTIHATNAANTIDGGAGADQMYGLDGNDTYVVDNAGDRVFETLTGGTDTVLAGITFKLGSGVENLTLTGASSIDGTGNSLANMIIGNNGSNELVGQTDNDVLTGNGGNDLLNGGEGADNMAGGTGNDTYYVDNAGDVTTENASEGTDVVKASVTWTLGANIENLTQGGSASIDATGNSLANSIHGNGSANVLGGAGGDDSLNAGAGADTLVGGTGRDTMIGGADNDLFVFADGDFGGATRATSDRITDFTSGDRIDLSAVDANTLLASDQSFSFIGTGGFTHAAGELRYEQVAGNTYVSGDTNGDGIADFMIKLDGLHTVQADDLVL